MLYYVIACMQLLSMWHSVEVCGVYARFLSFTNVYVCNSECWRVLVYVSVVCGITCGSAWLCLVVYSMSE